MNPVRLITPRRFVDDRGWFTEIYSEAAFAALGLHDHYVQDNHSLSRPKGTLRGLHFQLPPHAQAKLVRCIRGAIFDVAVDIRAGSPTFGRWVGAILSADNGHQLYIPVGFAHGFLTIEENTEVMYKVTKSYAPASDGGIVWNDPDIGIGWPLEHGAKPFLSLKDRQFGGLTSLGSPFGYDGQPLLPLEV